MVPKQAGLDEQKEQVQINYNLKEIIILPSGRKVKLGYIMNPTQDKINQIYVEEEISKKRLDENDPKSISRVNKHTRQYFAKAAAAILLNDYIKIALFYPIKWRIIYYIQKWTGDDYLALIAEAKKKATEQQYNLAMALLVTMTDMWTTMTKKEAEEYRAELDLVREHQSLKSSQASDNL